MSLMLQKIKNHKKLVIVVIVFLIYIYIVFFSRFRMYYLPTGEYLKSLESPNSAYTLKAYRYSGGATVDWSLRVEVVNNSNNKKYNIYYRYHDYDAEMEWLDDNTVKINGKSLNIHKEYYRG